MSREVWAVLGKYELKFQFSLCTFIE